ncbi:MAG: DUF58 domain-containing protein [Pirellulales bacterium]
MKSSALHGSNLAPGQSPRLGTSFIDPGALMRIKNLELRAKIVVEGFMSGMHRSPYHGFSVEFSEYRQYSPGDDTRYLDWRLLARTDRYYIKRFEEETNLRCHLLVDMSRSMAFGTTGYEKLDYARTIAATVAYFLTLQRDAVGLLAFDEAVVEYLPPRYRPGHLHRLMLALGRPAEGKATDIDAALERTAALLTKRGLVVLISDLLAPTEMLEKHLGYLRSRGHEVVVLRVLDPSEVDFTFDSPAMFHDVESGRQMYVDPESVRADYLRRFAEHAAAIKKTCLNLGVDFSTAATSEPLELALFDFLHARQQRGGKTAQRSANPAATSAGGTGSASGAAAGGRR